MNEGYKLIHENVKMCDFHPTTQQQQWGNNNSALFIFYFFLLCVTQREKILLFVSQLVVESWREQTILEDLKEEWKLKVGKREILNYVELCFLIFRKEFIWRKVIGKILQPRNSKKEKSVKCRITEKVCEDEFVKYSKNIWKRWIMQKNEFQEFLFFSDLDLGPKSPSKLFKGLLSFRNGDRLYHRSSISDTEFENFKLLSTMNYEKNVN